MLFEANFLCTTFDKIFACVKSLLELKMKELIQPNFKIRFFGPTITTTITATTLLPVARTKQQQQQQSNLNKSNNNNFSGLWPT